VDRFLHPLRRLVLRRRLAGADIPRSILFVCHGNVCRSPYAAASFSRRLARAVPDVIRVSSAGFVGPDRTPPAEAVAAASRRGIDLESHRSSLVLADRVRASDIILVMSADQARAIRRRLGGARPLIAVLGDLDPHPIDSRTVRDPWDGDAEVFDASFGRIDRCVDSLVGLLVGDGVRQR
jgi:protein-tyrosine phosphatase